VLVEQSRWIVARAAGFRRQRPGVGSAPASYNGRHIPHPGSGPESGSLASAGPSRSPTPVGRAGVAVHHVGTLPSPEVPGNRGPPVRTSHFRGSAPTVRSLARAETGDPRVAREGRQLPARMSRRSRLGGIT